MNELLEILAELVKRPSISPLDAGCQSYMMGYLEALGFEVIPLDNPPVSNFFARLGKEGPLLVFAGHTDVVPVGHREQWHSDPFVLTEKDGQLYGRGVADMKGSLAAMLLMAKELSQAKAKLKGSLGLLITSGEEGNDYHLGTPYVMEQLQALGIKPNYCIVGEPSSTARLGDTLKIGRRGSLSAEITIHGKQGHVAYPHLADNPIHRLAPALAELTAIEWDKGNDYFPPTSMQITALAAGGEASNVIPHEVKLQLNFRFSTQQTEQGLKERVVDCFNRHQVKTSIHWRLNGQPFLTSHGKLLTACQAVISDELDIKPELSTSGGTSDGRFIAPYGVEVIELGPVNASIHQVNEQLAKEELIQLKSVYRQIASLLLT